MQHSRALKHHVALPKLQRKYLNHPRKGSTWIIQGYILCRAMINITFSFVPVWWYKNPSKSYSTIASHLGHGICTSNRHYLTMSQYKIMGRKGKKTEPKNNEDLNLGHRNNLYRDIKREKEKETNFHRIRPKNSNSQVPPNGEYLAFSLPHEDIKSTDLLCFTCDRFTLLIDFHRWIDEPCKPETSVETHSTREHKESIRSD